MVKSDIINVYLSSSTVVISGTVGFTYPNIVSTRTTDTLDAQGKTVNFIVNWDRILQDRHYNRYKLGVRCSMINQVNGTFSLAPLFFSMRGLNVVSNYTNDGNCPTFALMRSNYISATQSYNAISPDDMPPIIIRKPTAGNNNVLVNITGFATAGLGANTPDFFLVLTLEGIEE